MVNLGIGSDFVFFNIKTAALPPRLFKFFE